MWGPVPGERTGNTLVTTYLLPQNLALGFPLGARENVGLQLAWRAETIFFTSSSQHWVLFHNGQGG